MAGNLKFPVITIGREYGSGGRTVAEGLSEKLGIPYYDKDFVVATSKESGYSEDEINKEGEQMNHMSEFINNLLNNSAAYISSFDAIYDAQKKVILELAKEPCIIVGRCADYILREAGVNAFNVFLFADLEKKAARAAQLPENQGTHDIKKLVQKCDELRNTYYKHYTGEEMRYYKQYDICLDTGVIGTDKCIEILAAIIQG
ncbi:MAG: cytidylate kinase-like family protein [Lachnospiraceae bacterium]|nr:cytidylate kinase-like family protein [Lachnospiraceae bacterium]